VNSLLQEQQGKQESTSLRMVCLFGLKNDKGYKKQFSEGNVAAGFEGYLFT
jgi:hypothetical protein